MPAWLHVRSTLRSQIYAKKELLLTGNPDPCRSKQTAENRLQAGSRNVIRDICVSHINPGAKRPDQIPQDSRIVAWGKDIDTLTETSSSAFWASLNE